MAAVEAMDLSARTKHFRNSLIEEFRLSESDTSNVFEAPRYSSDAFRNRNTVAEIMRHKPHTLIKFKIFKRNCATEEKLNEAQDRGKRKPVRLQRAQTTLTPSQWAAWLSNHPHFSSFIIGVIVFNAAILGVQTFLDEVEDWKMSQVLEIVDLAIGLIFFVEIMVKWVANFRDFWKDGWNNFDFLVTTGTMVPIVAKIAIGGSSDTKNFATLAKNLRIFRTFRTLKMIAKFRSLRIIVRTIVEALQSLGFVLVLLFLLMYIFAVLAISLFSDYASSPLEGLLYQDKFVDIFSSVRTLFQLLTLDQWYNIAKEISSIPTINSLVTICYFVVWVALGAFIFRNIFIGVMVRNFQNISQELSQLDQAHKKKVRMERYARDLHEHIEERGRTMGMDSSLVAEEDGDNMSVEGQDEGSSNSTDQVPDPARGTSSAKSSREGSGRKAGVPREKDAVKDVYADADKADAWQRFVMQSIKVFQDQDPGSTLWPRDTLLEYLQTMERLQENMKEFQELQHLASLALYNIVAD